MSLCLQKEAALDKTLTKKAFLAIILSSWNLIFFELKFYNKGVF